MNKNSNYLKFSRNTFIITIIFLIVSFCAILCIQRVIDSGEYKGVDTFEINDDVKSNSNSNSQSNSNDNSNSSSNETSKSNESSKSNKKSSKSSNKKSKSNKPSNKTPENSGQGGSHQEEEPKDDGKVEYVVTKNKDIFENEYFDNNKIAPGVSGTYEFDVFNNRKSKVKYKINTSNINNSNINLQYRLKRNNEYVIGNDNTWVNISDLNLNNILLNSKVTHSYTLEWRWPYEGGVDNIDTEIGKTNNSKYELKISVYAEEV